MDAFDITRNNLKARLSGTVLYTYASSNSFMMFSQEGVHNIFDIVKEKLNHNLNIEFITKKFCI